MSEVPLYAPPTMLAAGHFVSFLSPAAEVRATHLRGTSRVAVCRLAVVLSYNPSTLTPQPHALHPKPETRNPKPET